MKKLLLFLLVAVFLLDTTYGPGIDFSKGDKV